MLATDDQQERRWRVLLRNETSRPRPLDRGALAIELDETRHRRLHGDHQRRVLRAEVGWTQFRVVSRLGRAVEDGTVAFGTFEIGAGWSVGRQAPWRSSGRYGPSTSRARLPAGARSRVPFAADC